MVTMNLSRVKSQESKVEVEPSYSLVWTSRPNVSGHKTHRVYPIDIADSLLNGRERMMRDFFAKTARNLFDKFNKNVSIKP